MSDDEIDCHPAFFFMNIMMLFSLTKESDMIGNDIYSRSSIFWLYFIIMIYPTIFFIAKYTQNQQFKNPLAQCAEHFDLWIVIPFTPKKNDYLQ